MRAKELLENKAAIMLTSKQFEQDQERAIEELAKFAVQNCQPYLDATSRGYVLYRGFASLDSLDNDALAFTKPVRVDRVPRDTREPVHELFDKIIKMCGKVANRSNSLFTTSNKGVSSVYGAPYVILPIGQFNYTWHEYFVDWSTQSNIVLRKALISPEEIVLDDAAKVMTMIRQRPDAAGLEGEELEQHIRYELKAAKQNQWHHTVHADPLKLLDHEKIQKEFCRELRGDDDTLMQAMSTMHEVMIHCKQVFAIAPSLYEAVEEKIARLQNES